LLDSLAATMPEGTTWTRPRGGYCCWVTLPPGGSYGDLNRAALQAGVAYTPGEVFLAGPDDRTHLRLCFGGTTPSAIRGALGSIGRLVEQRLAGSPTPHADLKAAPLV
jgi:DNA-binding transcriptional MocR family regulator